MFEPLERRAMFSGGTPLSLTINGTQFDDVITLSQSGNMLTVVKNGVTSTHALSGITPGATPGSWTQWTIAKVVVNGLSGDDSIQANNFVLKRLEIFGGNGHDVVRGGAADDLLCGGTSKTAFEWGDDNLRGLDGDDEIHASMYGDCTLRGDDGDDDLRGYDGDDSVEGGAGNDLAYCGAGHDTARGGAGNDSAHGQNGNDQLHGDAGTDWLYGEANDDRLFPGADVDFTFGGDGSDTLVSIGGTTSDNNYGQGGTDSFWVDAEASEYTDATASEIEAKRVHEVASFMTLRRQVFNVFETQAVSRELNGQNFIDPMPINAGYSAVDYSADNPLFGTYGPSENDVFQGATGDCYFLAKISAFADRNPEFIRQLVTDLGDGTYAVHFRKAGQDAFIRIDGDLWTTSGGDIVYAKLGQQGAMWCPIVEKAWAFLRRDVGTYQSIWGGNGSGVTWYEALGINFDDVQIKESANCNTATEYLLWIAARLAEGKAVWAGGPAAFDESAFEGERTGQHIYMVRSVNFVNGQPVSITLRDPYGPDRTVGAQHFFNRNGSTAALQI